MGCSATLARRSSKAACACAGLSLALGLVLLQTEAAAERRTPEDEARDLIEQAVQAYQNLEMEDAAALADRALAVCDRQGITGELLAHVEITYGTILALGLNRLAEGREHLLAAARQNAGVEPDPMLSAPLLDQLWDDVLAELGQRETPTGPGEQPPATFGRGRVVHTPVPEQVEGHAVPVYLEIEGVAEAARVLLSYRGPGMRSFLTLDMRPWDDGYAGRVPCHRVREPDVSYYVTVLDSSGERVTGAGTEEEPFRVAVRQELEGPEPHLPGGTSEPPCSEDQRDGDGEPTSPFGRRRLMYFELQIGTGAGIPFGTETRTCSTGQDRVVISPTPSWTQLLLAPEIGFYVIPQVTLGVRARLQVPLGVYPDAPFDWGVLLRARWLFLPEDPIRVFAHVGGGYGEINHYVELEESASSHPVCGNVYYKTAGPGIVLVGVGMMWDAHRHVAIGAELNFYFYVPELAIQGDLAFLMSASF